MQEHDRIECMDALYHGMRGLCEPHRVIGCAGDREVVHLVVVGERDAAHHEASAALCTLDVVVLRLLGEASSGVGHAHHAKRCHRDAILDFELVDGDGFEEFAIGISQGDHSNQNTDIAVL